MIVMKKTVNPETQRPYTISMIERFMRDLHFAVDPNTNTKKQVCSWRFLYPFCLSLLHDDILVFKQLFVMKALELIRQLQTHFQIIRAKMRLQLIVPVDKGSNLTDKLKEWGALIEQSDTTNGMLKVVRFCNF